MRSRHGEHVGRPTLGSAVEGACKVYVCALRSHLAQAGAFVQGAPAERDQLLARRCTAGRDGDADNPVPPYTKTKTVIELLVVILYDCLHGTPRSRRRAVKADVDHR